MSKEDKIRGFGPLPKIISYIPDEELAHVNWDKIPNLSKYYGQSAEIILISTPKKLFEGPMIFAKFPRPDFLNYFGKKEEPRLEQIDDSKIFWETTGNYLFLQDAKY